jgi:hypothetical protein
MDWFFQDIAFQPFLPDFLVDFPKRRASFLSKQPLIPANVVSIGAVNRYMIPFPYLNLVKTGFPFWSLILALR